MNDLQLRLSKEIAQASAVTHRPIGRLLLDQGKIQQQDLQHALELQRNIDAPLGDIMVSEGLVDKQDILSALAAQAQIEGADLELRPPAVEMAKALPVELCLRFGVVPWRQESGALYVATSNPADFAQLRSICGPRAVQLFPVIVDDTQIRAQQKRLYGTQLAHQAATKVPIGESCRNWGQRNGQRSAWAFGVLAVFALAFFLSPFWSMTVLSLWAVVTLIMTSALKAAALIGHIRAKPTDPIQPISDFRMPRVSVLVPLLKEREIASQLIARLSALTYPKFLLEVVLVLEESDTLTRETIAHTDLPDWMSVIEVPEAGELTTKPRALNYALNFCKGSIIGVWDAEDWPEADQIEKVVSRFHSAPSETVCLQGILDYYNSRTSWLARCFTIEYAMWWRIIMPGIARLGLVVPLGGTTLFFRRKALEELGGWDAHNVTEDADLGVRLARHGYKTELLPTVTREEATSRPWPWVRQRSRWLKGFLITYCVHMRSPRALMRDLGLWRFLGLQTIFLAAVSQFAMAPFLWSFWMTLAGLTHPVAHTLGEPVVWALATLFLATEILSLILGITAVSKPGHRHLIPFVPTMMVYFTLGTLAAYKALWELVRQPFYWDKTQHGISSHIDQPSEQPPTP
ncbi:MAG: glycosyltransferase family 2 protein [Roseobacter sp.]